MNMLTCSNVIKNLSVIAILLGIGITQNIAASELESACIKNVQNKIAWDVNSPYETAQKWEQPNLEKLCKGTTKPEEPGKCFHELMTGHVNWGTTDKWEWKNAISLCAGTDNSDQRILCFKDRVKAGEKWDAAIFQCQSSNHNLNNKVPEQ